MRPQEIIAKKRDGYALSQDEVEVFVNGVSDGTWADYQISALVMAMFVRGLDDKEQEMLTRAMLHSGDVLDLSDIDEPTADKHSTGGVGDKTSLIIAPLAAACGLAVPMISGRGLGHTGGTLDKLESIAGYNVNLSAAQFKRVLMKCGYAMAGQTAEIVPADKKLYALRDATATVPCIPLIVASIMSKKLAEDLDALVLDVKTGAGAFMQKFDDSKRLAEALVKTGKSFGVKTEAVISDMSQPLGKYVGNALEVYECLEILRGNMLPGAEDTWALSRELTARLLVNAGVSDSVGSARDLAEAKLQSGEAIERFRQNVEAQGGDPSICDDPRSFLANGLPNCEIRAGRSGYIAAVDALVIGDAVCGIGGGRTMADDRIDHAVGYECRKKIGDEVAEGEILGVLYCRKADDPVVERISGAHFITEQPQEKPKLVAGGVG